MNNKNNSFFGSFGNPSPPIKLFDKQITQETLLVLFSGIILFGTLWLRYGLSWRVFSIIPMFFVFAYKIECMLVHTYGFAQYISLLTFIITSTIVINIYKNRNA